MSVLTNVGRIISSSKHLPIAQKKIFPGLRVNSISMEFEIPTIKIEKFLLLLEKIQLQEFFPVRLLAFFLGLLL